MYNLLIYGSGATSDLLIRHYLDSTKTTILAFINDADAESEAAKVKNGVRIIKPEEIGQYSYDYILVAAGAYDKIKMQCINAGVAPDKIIGILPQESEAFKNIYDAAKAQVCAEFNLERIKDFFIREMPPLDMSRFFLSNEIFLDDKMDIRKIIENVDLQRAFALFSAAREIKSNNVAGNVAELGVYKGDFARMINFLFPDKKLYLFDTFEGFNAADLSVERMNNFSATSSFFNDTSVQLVISKMPYKDNCEIIKGKFPESVAGIEDVFSFVSIDADLFSPIYSGLEYFYKRLSPKGYIFVHDFNNRYFSGAREAVVKFCTEEGIGYVPIPDYNGSAIITK